MKQISYLKIFSYPSPAKALYFIFKNKLSHFCTLPLFLTVFGLINIFPSTSHAADKTTDDGIPVRLISSEPLKDDSTYIGVFVGAGRVYNEHNDTEGFANWGNPGSTVDYNETNPVGGLLIGKRLRINGVPLRLELDATFGNMSDSTNQLDPKGLDETAKSDISWLVTARAGLEQQLGPATLFANGGLALARVSNSVIDIDFARDKPPWYDPDDSFSDNSTRIGWVLGVGAEAPLGTNRRAELLRDDEGWFLRVEGSYIDLGDRDYEVNHSGNNSCGPGGERRPCV